MTFNVQWWSESELGLCSIKHLYVWKITWFLTCPPKNDIDYIGAFTPPDETKWYLCSQVMSSAQIRPCTIIEIPSTRYNGHTMATTLVTLVKRSQPVLYSRLLLTVLCTESLFQGFLVASWNTKFYHCILSFWNVAYKKEKTNWLGLKTRGI